MSCLGSSNWSAVPFDKRAKKTDRLGDCATGMCSHTVYMWATPVILTRASARFSSAAENFDVDPDKALAESEWLRVILLLDNTGQLHQGDVTCKPKRRPISPFETNVGLRWRNCQKKLQVHGHTSHPTPHCVINVTKRCRTQELETRTRAGLEREDPTIAGPTRTRASETSRWECPEILKP